MNYQKELNKFFIYKKQNNGIISKINAAKLEYNNTISRGNSEKNQKKAKTKLTRLENQINRYFEINPESFVIYKDSSKEDELLKIDRYNLEHIENYLILLIKNNRQSKQKLLKSKYEILFDLLDLKDGDEIISNLDDLNESILKNEKIINKLNLKKNEKKRELEEQINLLNLSLESIVSQLKTEENKELRKELLKEYNEVLDKKYETYKEYKEINIVEHKIINDENANEVKLNNIVEVKEELPE